MRPELRDKFIERLEEVYKWAGAPDYDEGVRQASTWLEALLKGINLMRTKDDVRRLFDTMSDPSFTEEKLILATLKYLPHMLHFWAKQFAAKAHEEFPPIPKGRPSLELQEKVQIVQYVGKLHIQGCSLEIAKARAEQRFGVSESSVQRAWDDRGSIDEADFRSALKWMAEQ